MGAKMTSLAGHSYNGSLYCFSHRSSLPRLLCKHTQAHTPTRIHTHAHTTVLAVSSLGSVSVACYQSTLIRSFCVCVCVALGFQDKKILTFTMEQTFPFGLRHWMLLV